MSVGDSERATSRRSSRAHAAVLDATAQLLVQRGYHRLTVDAISARAGVSKATVYRWWPHKAAVAVEAVLQNLQPEIAYPDTGSLQEDLTQQAAGLASVLRRPGLGATLISLLALAAEDADLAAALRSGWQEPRRQAGREVVLRGAQRGEVPTSVDVEVLLDAVYGSVYLRALFGHAAVERAALAKVVTQAIAGASHSSPSQDH